MTEITYEKLDDLFYKLEYENINIVINSEGYINATKLCNDHGKNFGEWIKISCHQLNEFFRNPSHSKHVLKINIEGLSDTQGIYIPLVFLEHVIIWLLKPKFGTKITKEYKVVRKYKIDLINALYQEWTKIHTENTQKYWEDMATLLDNTG